MTKEKEYANLSVMMKLYKIPLQKLSPVINFQSRGTHQQMSYRHYPSWSTHTLVLFHGLVSNSMYLSTLAHRLAERKIAQVLIPDWRGHGDDKRKLEWVKNHDVIQDFEEMLIQVKSRTAVERITFLGHSFGARWMLKVLADAPSALKIDQGYLVAPFLRDPQMKMEGWYVKEANNYVLAWPEKLKTEKEVTEYPMAFLDHFNMSEQQLVAALAKSKFSLIEGSEDEILSPVGDLPVQKRLIIPEATHMGIVMDMKCIDQICDVIEAGI